MTLRQEVRDWLDSSGYDFETSKIMYDTGRYSYCVFMCHQTIEKLLKAIIIHVNKEIPKKSHNLRELLADCNFEVPADIETKILKLNPHYMFSRYPDIAGGPSYKMYNKQIAKECMDITEEAVTWLKQKLQ
jgi:HEPN domain-containing protein